MDIWDSTTLVSFSAQTCAIPPCMKERAYRILILSSSNVSSGIMMAIQMDQTNCLAFSLLLSKLSSLTALVFLDEWLLVTASILVRIAQATDDMALVAVSVTLPWASKAWSLSALLVI